jgi:hypothetical protein
MASVDYTWVIDKGADVTLSFELQQDNSEIIDLSGYSASFIVYPAWGSAATLTLTSSPAAGVSIDTATGIVTVTLTDTQTAALTQDTYFYHFRTTSGGGLIDTWARGEIQVKP